ncbi:DinB family protein [Acuticoccus mangrovi]|uniref:Damage-inducible protein DinB n=1 Tax=Acuticoccus mangrovi TaxID=2796142 RepID=A0A934IR78_9HYPH|nr:DinB family protein [Acuticoccus mangrovi]MBJ3776782.1 damage-inducible protein DinB [Acuticoccus mangrovi]
MKPHFQTFARYNAWANRRLYDAAAALSDDDYRADCGAFFHSVHGTLNHLVTADLIWMKRVTGEGEAPSRLDAIVAEEFATLRPMREALDARIVATVDGKSEADLAGTITFRRATTPEVFTQPLAPVLAHFFNHQTHHRGQVHAMLTRLVGEAPELDLLYYLREVG